MSMTDRPISHQESIFLVRWLRKNKQVLEFQFDQKYFVKRTVAGVIAELKTEHITVTEKEVLTAIRRIMAG